MQVIPTSIRFTKAAAGQQDLRNNGRPKVSDGAIQEEQKSSKLQGVMDKRSKHIYPC